MGEQTLLGKFFGGCFRWGLMIRSCKGVVNGSEVSKFKLIFCLIDPGLGYWYIIWKVNTKNRGLNLKKTFFTLCLLAWGFHLKSVFFFKKIIVVTYPLVSWLQGSFRFTYLRARLLEKWVKALHSELEGS